MSRKSTPRGLLDGIPPALEAGRLRSKVIRTPARQRRARHLGRIEPRLAGRPAMALELVLPQLLLGLTVLRVHDQRPGYPRRRRRSLALNLRGWTYRFVLANRRVPPIVDVIRIVVGNAFPPDGRVIERQSRNIQTQPDACPAPRPVPAAVAASPAIIAAPPPVVAASPAVAAAVATISTAIAPAVAAVIAATVAAVIAATVATVADCRH